MAAGSLLHKIAAKMTRTEQRIVQRCTTPLKIQRFINALPYNFESPETMRSFRGSLKTGRAHCLEAAFIAAVILEQHGHPPLLMDLVSKDQLDHVVVLYQRDGLWGCIARSRDPGLHGRKPLFRTLEKLVRSYVLPYIDMTGRIRGYGVLDLRAVARVDWRFSLRNVWGIERALIKNKHKRFKTSDAEYKRWHNKYKAFKARYPKRKPMYYPNRHEWL